MRYYFLIISFYLFSTYSFAEKGECISNSFTINCSKGKEKKEIESNYDNVRYFFRIGNSNIKIAKK
jgi:hypothetical protein